MLDLNFSPFPILETERLRLRQITEQDGQEMFLLRSNPETMQYIPRELPKNIDDAIAHIQYMEELRLTNECLNWAITLKGEDKVIGLIGYFRPQPENYRAEIGYMLSPDHQRKGIIQEALTKAITYGFDDLKLHSIIAITDTENDASWKLLEKNNFIREGHFREDTYWNGRFSDSYIYALRNKS
ncbi:MULTISPECIES: GNAT family N-acetyltransferase [unclassified Flavobacterium]|uniref:GNAT family N-acetyltransferase n=1 Tax=unclassified Flavobacterium TaxID=196869 RepID=UPI00086BB467|nr:MULTISPECIES: GNAT family N-acetyltransferase [unclassified Flavobacterium]MBN9282947.1 GNAT family N-acetyltransferase [Flavobacterium sp.]ODS78874.1 MAG: alanine acetyltransferase [Chryseobacterium sp. SCN 40-13]OJV67584.1 MAG: alanine acetyltransferase [Flavobacterium sp. 40-81]